MKMSLDGFTKIAKEDNITTLRHPAGHEIKVNHSTLSPKMRGEIEALPKFAKGTPDAPVDTDTYNVGENKVEPPAHLQVPTMRPEEGSSEELPERQQVLKQPAPADKDRDVASEPEKLADGGQVDTKQAAPQSLPEPEVKEPTKEEKAEESRKEAEGNAPKDAPPVPKPEGAATPSLTPTTAPEYDHAAANSEILKNLSAAAAAHFNMTAGATPGADQTATTSDTPQPVSAVPATTSPAVQATSATPAINTPGTVPSSGIPQQAQTNLNAAQTAQSNFDQYRQDAEAKNMQLFKSAMAQKIDPNRLYNNSSTGAKILSAIGMIFGGIGATAATGGKNLGAEALNNLVARDIDLQKNDQSNKMNLYKMNLEATHNEEEARNMSMNQLLTLAQADIAKQAAATQNQQAQQNLIMGGLNIDAKKRENDQAAFMAKMRQQALTGGIPTGTPGQLSNQNPADLTQFLVPEAQIKDVSKEIKEAQDTRKLTPEILAAFDNASKSKNLTDLVPGTKNADQKQFSSLINTTVKEQEGTARQAAFKSIEDNMMPQAFDSAATLAKKRQAVQNYLESKSSAPIAKTYGIDLDKFKSTSQQSNFTPQQQNSVKLMLKQNPKSTESEVVDYLRSKKLGGF